MADRNLLCNISWNQINALGWITGSTTVTIDGHTYKVRLLTGGTSSSDTGSEWNTLTSLTTSDDVMHWQYCASWCSETLAHGAVSRRGWNSATDWNCSFPTVTSVDYGFRPALELVN